MKVLHLRFMPKFLLLPSMPTYTVKPQEQMALRMGPDALEGERLTEQDGRDPPLGIHGEAFVEPELPPVGIGDQVPKPAVGDLMDDDIG